MYNNHAILNLLIITYYIYYTYYLYLLKYTLSTPEVNLIKIYTTQPNKHAYSHYLLAVQYSLCPNTPILGLLCRIFSRSTRIPAICICAQTTTFSVHLVLNKSLNMNQRYGLMSKYYIF